MFDFEFRKITVDHIPKMTELLIVRQHLESNVFPFLKNSCLTETYIRDELEKLFDGNKVIGIGAFDGNELVGYMFGEITNSTRVGRYASVPYEGVAIREGQHSELIRYLYAKVAVLWLEQGCFSHSTYVPIANQMYYDAFLRLSFSIEQVHAVMDIEEYKPFETVADVDVRIASKGDREIMGNMSNIISKFQNSSPVFIPAYPDVVAKIKEGFKGLVEEENDIVLIAEKNSEELGFQDYEIITPTLMTPDNVVELCIAGTRESKMGSGIGKKLMNEAHKIIKDKGYGYIKTDWRITNLASSIFWPKCGFKPIAYRMARTIDSNNAWANYDNRCMKQNCQ